MTRGVVQLNPPNQPFHRAQVVSHTARFDTIVKVPIYVDCRLGPNTLGVLGKCELYIQVEQENPGGRGSDTLGWVTIDVTEFLDLHHVSRRFLLQGSRTNAKLRIACDLELLSHDALFQVSMPPSAKPSFPPLDGYNRPERSNDPRTLDQAIGSAIFADYLTRLHGAEAGLSSDSDADIIDKLASLDHDPDHHLELVDALFSGVL
ncbi:hypothetical protein BDK51DRAFT_51525 [Blyttiomyces helicus]|uniref:C2 NT-type domain-containing protein n=1 Tax=Blyttiomyces helicus TaxID=388810 RepID=A0A4P9WJ10_9FUNG|nr:hypothetical protein BDK51DRAFT_51525 [Blyttiomyces helicus]|eukprot:RKO92804.1 hypothetical protein BDK51DRAFT_51525 [Blyttiomyces helicus]